MWQRMLDAQYRRPSGLPGWWIGWRMFRQHSAENSWTVDLLRVKPNDCTLEIGFGPGAAIYPIAEEITVGRIAGVDLSRIMVIQAKMYNHEAEKRGILDLRRGDAANLLFEDASFDKAYSIHSIYFWRQPIQALKEIHRVLRFGGMLVLTILPREKMTFDPKQILVPGAQEFTPYYGDDLVRMLLETGFRTAEIRTAGDDRFPSKYSVVGVK